MHFLCWWMFSPELLVQKRRQRTHSNVNFSLFQEFSLCTLVTCLNRELKQHSRQPSTARLRLCSKPSQRFRLPEGGQQHTPTVLVQSWGSSLQLFVSELQRQNYYKMFFSKFSKLRLDNLNSFVSLIKLCLSMSEVCLTSFALLYIVHYIHTFTIFVGVSKAAIPKSSA